MKHVLSVTLLVLAAGIGAPARAQLSAPDLLSSQFSGDNQTIAHRLTLLAPLRGPTPPPGVTVGIADEKTIHTIRSGEGVLEDLHANSRFESLRAALGKANVLPQIVVDDRELDNAGTLDESGPQGTTFTMHGHEEQPEIGLLWTLRGATLTLSAARDAYHAAGTSSVYAGVFPLFSQTPPFAYEKDEDNTSADVSVPLSRALAVEASIGWESAPGFLSLQNNQAEIRVPMSDNGTRVMGAVRWRPAPRLTLAAYADDGDYQGTGSVKITGGQSIGQGASRRSEIAQGLGAQISLRGGRLTLFDEYSRIRWNVDGTVPNPGSLGLSVSLLGDNLLADGAYHALYQVSNQTWGAHWDRPYRAAHALSLECRRLRLDPTLEADYNARVLLFPLTGETQFTPGPKWGELLQARYQFPWLHLINSVTAAQAIPDISRSGGGSSGSGSSSSPGSPRETSGGWSLAWTIERTF